MGRAQAEGRPGQAGAGRCARLVFVGSRSITGRRLKEPKGAAGRIPRSPVLTFGEDLVLIHEWGDLPWRRVASRTGSDGAG